MIFEDRIQENPRLFRLKDPRTNEIVDFEIQDLLPSEIVQEGTEIDAAYLNGLLTYTTEEKIIGYWIDGKPIYRKVVDCGALPNAQGKNVAHGISNLKRIINAYGYSYNSQIGVTYPLPCVNSEGVGYQVALRFQGNNIVLTSGSTDRTDFAETYVIIEYTKTTD